MLANEQGYSFQTAGLILVTSLNKRERRRQGSIKGKGNGEKGEQTQEGKDREGDDQRKHKSMHTF